MKFISLILLFLFAAPVFSDETGAFLVGALRSDGVIIPFASYDGSRWDTPWPAADTSADTTLKTLDALPKKWYAPLASVPREWYARTVAGGFRALRVDRPLLVKSRSSEVWGLAPNPAKEPEASSREPKAGAVSKEGIVFSRNVQTRSVAAVGKESEEWRTLQVTLRGAFAEAEDKKGHPLSREVREREELTFPALFRGEADPDGSTIYSFEAVRNYVSSGLLPGTSPAGVSSLRGWLRRDRTGSFTFIQREFFSERFTAPRESALTPLGILNPGGTSLWVVQVQERGSESYRILEVGRTGIRVIAEMFGGS